MDVLLVEDGLGDIRLTLEAFRDANPAVHLHVTKDGAEAMAFLRREGETCQSSSPGAYPARFEHAKKGRSPSSG
jgi:hypothetical protein